MKDQGQHRISQVYLKQFGFQDKNGHWWVSTLKLGEEYTNNKSIKSFTKEINIFDIPSKNIKTQKTFEDFSGSLESKYPLVINEIKTNEKLSDRGLSILFQFMLNILCKTVPFRELITHLFKSPRRDYFLSEITYYHEDKGETLIEALNKIKIDYQLNFVIFSVWYYFVMKLTSFDFDYVILKDYDNRGWITTDNPVILKNSINESTIFSKETEIYFPISNEYCLYMDHMDYNRSNNLRGKNGKDLVDINESIQEQIYDYIWRNAYQYVINSTDLGRIKLSK